MQLYVNVRQHIHFLVETCAMTDRTVCYPEPSLHKLELLEVNSPLNRVAQHTVSTIDDNL
jgi:hypothetical protein